MVRTLAGNTTSLHYNFVVASIKRGCNQRYFMKLTLRIFFWKRGENIWGFCLTNLNIWISYQSEEGAWEIESLVVTLIGPLITHILDLYWVIFMVSLGARVIGNGWDLSDFSFFPFWWYYCEALLFLIAENILKNYLLFAGIINFGTE